MVVSVVLNRLDKRLSVEVKLRFELLDNLHVNVVQVSFCTKTLRLRLMELVPRVFSDFLDADSFFWIRHEDLGYEIPPTIRDEPRKSVVCAQDLLVEIRRFLVLDGSSIALNYLEGQIAAEHCVKHDTTAPEVRL